MEQSGEYSIRAPRERVWAALNDPAVLCRCIQGCQRFEATGDDRYATEVKAKVGPLSATFKGTVSLVDIKAPESYGLELAVNSGAAGFGKGTANVTLAETEQGTLLQYSAAGTVGGKLAQIGQRLIDAAARKTADRFFEAFAEIVDSDPPENTVGDPSGNPIETDAEETTDDGNRAVADNGRRKRLALGAALALLLVAAFVFLQA